uniref:Uncharacterized protein n=1 Tax=Panagrolaimus sp. PS1159 TaxID=55785 RepID=A0AC35GV88_9BILA
MSTKRKKLSKMTTKEQFLKDKSKSFGNDNSNRYSNINLDQNQKCLDFSIVQSNSKSNNDKLCEKEKSQKWNKTSKIPIFSNINDKFEERHKNYWTKDDSLISATNKSTLSLHISVYENSNECTNLDLDVNEKGNLIERFENKKRFFIGSSSLIQNLFEFPRQQETGEEKIPEIAEFKVSQKLLSFNKTDIEQQRYTYFFLN